MNRVIEKLVAGFSFHTFLLQIPCCIFLYFYLLFCTQFWWLIVLYSIWIYVFDSETCEKHGRRFEFLRNLTIWEMASNYLSHSVKFEPGVHLDPKHNYIFACFPHGVLPIGTFLTSTQNQQQNFPHHVTYMLSQRCLLKLPFHRDFLLGLGLCAVSAKCIRWLLDEPSGKKVLLITVGGAQESFNTRPGNYHFVLKNRKGFVKIALEKGAHLVPVISFGETDLFDQIGTEGSCFNNLQRAIRKYIGFAPIVPVGCGLFQDRFGIIPRKKTLTTVVGQPISVEKVASPTHDQINELHQKFCNEIVSLFENNKHKYIKQSENVFVIIE